MKEFDFFKFNSNLIETMQCQSQTINLMFEPVLKVQQTFEPVFKAQQILAVNEAPSLKLAKEQEQILKKTTPLMFGTVQTYKSIYDDWGNSFKNSIAELNKTTAFLKDTLNVYPIQNIPFTNKEVPKTSFDENIELKYDEDCDTIDVCKQLGRTYNLCYKGALIGAERCSPAEQQSIIQQFNQSKLQLEIQDREDERLAREEKIQELRDKKAVRRSWVQLLVAAILGILFTKLIDLLPFIINWIKSLLI
ncbi:MAG: hypothetical protein ACLT45_09140 [Thomasclavelia spiroformis]